MAEQYRQKFDLSKLIGGYDVGSDYSRNILREMTPIGERLLEDLYDVGLRNVPQSYLKNALYLGREMGLIGPEALSTVHVHDLCSGWGKIAWIFARARSYSGQRTGIDLWDKDPTSFRGLAPTIQSHWRSGITNVGMNRSSVLSASLGKGQGPKVWISSSPGDIDGVLKRVKDLSVGDIRQLGSAPEMIGVLPCTCHCYPDRLPEGLQGHVLPEDWVTMATYVRDLGPKHQVVAQTLDALRVVELNNHSEKGVRGYIMKLPTGTSAIMASF